MINVRLDKRTYEDKTRACWIGKNIGGTMGAPYEGRREVKRIKINWLSLIKNYWIWILSILFVLADRALFIANADPDSRVTIMTLIKQSCCVVSIVGGKLIFKEKNILFKLFCAGIIVAGILLTVLI